MSVNRRPTDRFSNNKEQANRTTRHLIDVILANQKFLALADKRGTYLTKVRQIDALLKAGEDIAPWQYAVAEEAYERTMRGYGMPAADTHKDKRRNGLRYG